MCINLFPSLLLFLYLTLLLLCLSRLFIYIDILLLFCRTDELKDGTLVGEDKYGNKYYHNTRYFMGL